MCRWLRSVVPGSAVNREIQNVAVPDPESSCPSACVGAEFASIHFPIAPVGLHCCWSFGNVVGGGKVRSAVNQTEKLPGMLQLRLPW